MPYQEFLTSQQYLGTYKTVLILNSIDPLNRELKSSPEELPEVLTATYACVLTSRNVLHSQDAQYQVYQLYWMPSITVPAVKSSRPFLLDPKGKLKLQRQYYPHEHQPFQSAAHTTLDSVTT